MLIEKSNRGEMAGDSDNSKRIVSYMLFYFSVIIVLSFTSYLLDVFFYKIDYGTLSNLYYGPFQYVPFYMLIGFWSLPLSVGYNYIINKLQPIGLVIRVMACSLLCFIIFFLINGNLRFGYYIGEYRQIKNCFAALFSSIMLELLRNLVVRERLKRSGKLKKG